MRLAIIIMLAAFLFACQTASTGKAKYESMDQAPPGEMELINQAGAYQECCLHVYVAARQEVPPERAWEAAETLCRPQLDQYQDYLATKVDKPFAAEKSEDLKAFTAERLAELEE